MKTGNRVRTLLPAVLFFFILCMAAGLSAHAAEADLEHAAGMTDLSRLDITVSCDWDDNEDCDGIRPDHVTVSLYANGGETGRMITLSEENGWSGCFHDMDAYRNGARLSYSIIEDKVSGYTGTVSGCDLTGYRIVNIHEPFPKGKGSSEIITPQVIISGEMGVIVETVVTTKVSKSKPARSSTSTQKTRSAKTADTADPVLWECMMLCSCAALYIWMRIEQRRE